MYVHDPAALMAVVRPDLFTWKQGAVRVVTEGLARGLTIADENLRKWNFPNAWVDRPQVQIATAVQDTELVSLVLQRLQGS